MTRTIRILLAAVGGLVLASVIAVALGGPALAPAPLPALVPPSPPSSPAATPTTTPTTVHPDVDGAAALRHVAFFADPARGGRFTASAGYDASARYLADRFAEIGLEPWGDGGTFFQRFRMPLVDLSATPVLERLAPEAKVYRHRTDFTERVGGTFGSGAGEGQLVFIGSGIASAGASDFDVVDVRGKVALVIVAGRADPGRELARRGALAAIYVSDRILKFSYLPRFEPAPIPGIIVSSDVANELLAPAGKRLAELRDAVAEQARGLGSSPPPRSPAFELPVRLRVSVPLTPVRDVEATNVIGLLRGSDPDGAKRAVLVGGHLDGVGTDPDGTVFQAANDNASGPGLTIEVARSLIARRAELRHSAIFVAFAGEEQGLNGSEAFVTQMAALPGRRESLIGYLNLDVVGCCSDVVSASDDSDVMVDRVKRAAEALGVPFERGGGGSSDHVSFARRGVHATLLNWSDIGTIHTPADTIERVTAERLRTIGRVAALVTLEMAAGR